MFFKKTTKRHTSLHHLAQEIRWVGNVSLWAQVVLGLVPAIGWLILSATQTTNASRSGIRYSISWGLGSIALLALVFSIAWWWRNRHLARQLLRPEHRIRREQMQQSLEMGLIVNLLGMVLLMIAGLSYGWVLMMKVLANPQYTQYTMVARPAIVPLDIMTFLIIIHTVAAELVGVLGYLWLANRVDNYDGDFTLELGDVNAPAT